MTAQKKEQSSLKYFNLYEGYGLSKPYPTSGAALAAAEKYNSNYIKTFMLDLKDYLEG